mgnify:CR=1 FL=1
MANPAQLNYGDDKSIAYDAYAIVPHDTVNFTNPFKAIYVGVSGNIVLVPLSGGTAVTLLSVPIGILPIGGLRVNSTSTTATNLIGLR